jgi:hypothetical protein
MNNNLKKTLVTSILASGLAACSGQGSKPAPVVEPPVQPPVVEPAGLTLEQVVSRFNTDGGLNLTEINSVNSSFDSGANVSENFFNFSVENTNGSKVCVAYTAQDNDSNETKNFTFNDTGCDKALIVGGKADFDNVISNFDGYSAGAVIEAPVNNNLYDIFSGSEDISFKLKNGTVDVCTDSVTGTSDYIYTGLDNDGNSTISVSSGIYENEVSEGEKFSVSCNVTGTDGNVSSFSDVTNYTAGVGSIPADRLVDIIAEQSGNKILGRNVSTYLVENIGDDTVVTDCAGVLENDYGTRTCVEYAGNSVDTVSTSDIILNIEGIDYSVSVGGNSDVSEVSAGLVSRLGTPVLRQAKNNSANVFIESMDPATFKVKNVDMYAPTCELTSSHADLDGMALESIVGDNLSEAGFNNFSLVQFENSFDGGVSPEYRDANGNYNLGNLDCTFYSPNLGENVTIKNVMSISGNVNDDAKFFP